MKRFLVVVRRFFGGGIIGLVLAILLSVPLNSLYSEYCIYIVFSPFLYLIFLIICSCYNRKKGYTSLTNQPFVVTVLRMIGSDITAPFRCLWEFVVGTIVGHYPELYTPQMKDSARVISGIRFIWMAFLICIILYCTGFRL